MKLLFFSSDDSEVQLARNKCAEAGIDCEIRISPQLPSALPTPRCSELWLRKESDTHKAQMLCVTNGLGFSRRDKVEPVEPMEPIEEQMAA